MNKTGKYIAYLFFSLFTFLAFMASCTAENEPEKLISPGDKISLSISFHSAQQTKTQNGLRGTEIDLEGEKKIYSLAVFIFKSGTNELDGKKIINRELSGAADDQNRKDYKEVSEMKDIELTAGMRDIYIIANAPDNHFDGVNNWTSFTTSTELLGEQKTYGSKIDDGTSGETPIGGEVPEEKYTNLVMTQSFKNLPLNSGAEKHYLGYTENGGIPSADSPGTPLLDGDKKPIKVELVRLVARVAIQKISFNLPKSYEFETGKPTSNFNHYIDGVFMLNAKNISSYFPDEFSTSDGNFGQGNTEGYNFLVDKTTNISANAVLADYLYKPLSFPEYDIINNQVPLWFYAFENNQSENYPTGFVIGVKYQYINPNETDIQELKAYYLLSINREGIKNGKGHDFIKRNNQYGLNVTIKGVGNLIAGYSTKSASLRTADILSAQEDAGVLEIEETVGPNLFPWTGDIYK
ncbi:fimbrial protein [Limibacterium fermenti]|uniref:fimbrial protein n=1 Tax=Limibacterium fermenti TaxID=3229863 RepID=UPI003A692643